jgi:hypothetical protein
MKRFILSFAVLALISGLFAGSAEARGARGHGAIVRGYRTYPIGYRNWARVWYNPTYRVNWYYCGVCNEWFYYYPPMQQYLPVSQIATCPPTVVINNNVGVPPGAPMPSPGAPMLPPGAPMPSPGAPMPPGQ